jgi:hypothetical protein
VLSLCILAAQAAQVLPEPVVDPIAGSAGSVQPQPVQPRARTSRRLVYSCIEPGLVTYADRPCGHAASRRELKVRTPAVAAGAAPVVGAAANPADDKRRVADARSDAAAARAAAERAEACQQLETAADEVDSRMRAGYPAREAGRLWERWREVRARLREARC